MEVGEHTIHGDVQPLGTSPCLVATANLEFAPSPVMQVGEHTIHGDVETCRRHGFRSGSSETITGSRGMLSLVSDEQGSKLFGRVARSIGTDVKQGQTLKYSTGVGKGVLGSTKESEEFVESGAARASTEVEVGVEGMVAVSAGGTEIVGRGTEMGPRMVVTVAERGVGRQPGDHKDRRQFGEGAQE